VSKPSRIYAIALKEIRQLMRDRLTFGMIVGIPLIQMLLFGYAINFDVRGIEAGVVDESHTSFSRALIADLAATDVIRITMYCASAAELSANLRAGKIKVGIYVPADSERRRLTASHAGVQLPGVQLPVAQLLVDASEPSIESVVRGIAQTPLPGRAGSYTDSYRPYEIRTEYNPERRTAVQIVPALIGVILNMTMMIFTAVAIVREREKGNLELLITTPVSAAELMAGKLAPYVVIGLVQTTLILGLGALLFDVPINGSLVQLYLAASLFIASTLMLGLLISTLAQTQMQAFQMSFFLMLPSILLSGFMFPYDGMPKPAQWIAQILPLTHFNILVRGIILRDANLGDMTVQIVKLLCFLGATMTLAMLRFRKRLD